MKIKIIVAHDELQLVYRYLEVDVNLFSSAIKVHFLLFKKFMPYLIHIENILKFTFPFYNVKMTPSADGEFDSIKLGLGLGPNIRQFLVLVLVNAFVGAMIGLEQTVVPLMGKEEFGIESNALILSFIGGFEAVKWAA